MKLLQALPFLMMVGVGEMLRAELHPIIIFSISAAGVLIFIIMLTLQEKTEEIK